MKKRKFPIIGVKELRTLIGRKLADRVKVEPVYIIQLRMWVGYRSDGKYELLWADSLSHAEGRPVCERVNLFVGEMDMSDAYLIVPNMLGCGK